MIRNLSVTVFLCAITLISYSQDNTATSKKPSNFSFTGYVDGYFRYDFSKDITNNKTSFTNNTGGLALGMLSEKIDYAKNKFSFTADLGIGKRAKEFAYNDKGLLSSVKQLFASYQLTDWMKLTAGTWATHVGYEVVDPYVNRNYSMSYMFSYGPFLHTGLKSDFTFGKSGLMLGISNPTDYRKVPSANKKSLLLQYSYAFNDNTKLYLNYVGGQRPTDEAKIRQFDVVFTDKLNDEINIGFNGTINSTRLKKNGNYSDASAWSGAALYLNIDPWEKVGFTQRFEAFSDKNQLSGLSTSAYGGTIFANTISANIKIGPMVVVPEYRIENCSNKVFHDRIGAESNFESSFILAAYLKF